MRKAVWSAVATVMVALPVAGVAVGGPRVLAAEETRVAIVDVGPSSEWHYQPSDVTVTAGSTVSWRNEGQQPHTVTAKDKSFASPYLVGGAEWQWTFSAPGEFTYYCEPHPWMKALVRVEPASSSGGTTPPPAPAPPTTTTAPAPAPAAPAAAPPAKAAAPVAAPPAKSAPAPAPATTTTTVPVGAAAPAVTTTTAAPATTITLAPAGEEAAPAAATPTAAEDATEAQTETAAGPLPVSGGDNGDAGLLLLVTMAMAAVPVGGAFLLAKLRG